MSSIWKVSAHPLSPHVIISKGAEELWYKGEEAVHQTSTSTPHQEEDDELPLHENLGEGGRGGGGEREGGSTHVHM